MSENEIKKLLIEFNQKPIAIYPVYIDLTGSVTAGLLLSQIMYWYGSVKREFYKTDAELMQETRLTITEFKNAKRIISELPFVHIQRKGIPAKTYYDIDLINLSDCIVQTSSQVTYHQGKRLPANKRGDNLRTITENTQENNTENTSGSFSYEKEAPKKKQAKKQPRLASPPGDQAPNMIYTLYTQYATFFESRAGAQAFPRTGAGHLVMDAKDARALKDFVKYFGEVHPGSPEEAWGDFLEAAWQAGDKWIRENFCPHILWGQKNRLFTRAAKATTPRIQATDEEAEAVLRAMEELGGEKNRKKIAK